MDRKRIIRMLDAGVITAWEAADMLGLDPDPEPDVDFDGEPVRNPDGTVNWEATNAARNAALNVLAPNEAVLTAEILSTAWLWEE